MRLAGKCREAGAGVDYQRLSLGRGADVEVGVMGARLCVEWIDE